MCLCTTRKRIFSTKKWSRKVVVPRKNTHGMCFFLRRLKQLHNILLTEFNRLLKLSGRMVTNLPPAVQNRTKSQKRSLEGINFFVQTFVNSCFNSNEPNGFTICIRIGSLDVGHRRKKIARRKVKMIFFLVLCSSFYE